MLDLAIKPGLKNFFFTLLVWIAGVFFVSATSGDLPFTYVLKFYAKWSWPNFFFFYLMAIWIIPMGMKKETLKRSLLSGTFVIVVFVIVRYFNNIYWAEDYYVGYTLQNEKYEKSWFVIASNEVFKLLQIAILALTYRLILERVLILRDKRDLEKAKTEAELAALRHQLNPHFLFNSINSIYFLALKKSDRTPDALLKLAELLRYVLNQKEEWVSIDKELEYIDHMISFEKIRFPEGRINMNVEIAPSRRNMLIPSMLLTPFVENAFKHGEPGSEEKPISIRLELSGDHLSFMVVNPVAGSLAEPKGNGIGLGNLKRRLEIIYKDNYLIEVKEIDKYFFAKLEINLV